MADRTHKTVFELSAVDRATSVFKTVEGGLGGLTKSYAALGVAAAAAFGAGGVAAFVADAVRYRAALDDLADVTGDNVRTLDGMARQARISGLEIDQLSSALGKFARNLNAADDEGQAAAQAIQAIGLNVAELRAMKPADAMLEVAKALEQWSGSGGKVAVAEALMGKEGRRQLPFLKDLAEAGELQGRITAEQAAQAERLEQEWRKLKITFEDGKQSLASSLIPEMSKLVEQMREGIRIAGSFGSALMLFGVRMAPIGAGEHGGRIQEYLAEIEQLRASSDEARATMAQLRGQGETDSTLGGYSAGIDENQRRIGIVQKKLDFAKFLQRQEAMELAGDGSLDARDLRARQKPNLNFVPQKPGGGGSDRDRELERLAKLAAKSDEDALKAEQEKMDERDEIARRMRLANKEVADSYLDLAEPSRVYLREQEKLNKALEQGALTLAEYQAVQRYLQDTKANVVKLGESASLAADAGHAIGLSFTSAMDRLVFESGRGVGALDLLRAAALDVAKIIYGRTVTTPIAQGIEKGVSSLFSGWGDKTYSDSANAPPFHSGGIVGSEGGAPRLVHSAYFDRAPRMHSGGLAGDEVPAILQRGEGVFTRQQMKALGGGRGGVTVIQHNNFAVGVRGEVRAEIANMMPVLARAAEAAVRDGNVRGRA